MRQVDRFLAVLNLVITLSTSRREAGVMGTVRQVALGIPSQGFRGVINRVVDIIIALEVAWTPGQHMHMHMRHRLPSMHSILQQGLHNKNIRAKSEEDLHCCVSRCSHTESCGCKISISAAARRHS